MPEIVISDFSGGRNTRDAINLVADNQASDQENTWVENRALTQRRGFTAATLSGDGGTEPQPQQLLSTLMGASSAFRLIVIGYHTVDALRYLGYTDNGTAVTFAGYIDGSVSVTSATVTGSGTAFTTHCAAGDIFKVNSDGTHRAILTVDSDTQLTLASAYPSNYGAGTGYTVLQKIVTGIRAAFIVFDVSGVQNVWVADGSRAYRYTGTTVYRADNLYSMPAGKYLVSFKNYLFVMGHNDTDIRWSALNNPTSWPAANLQTVTTPADPVLGGIVYNDMIVIFTRNRLFRFSGNVFDPSNPTYTLAPIATPPGYQFKYYGSACVHLGVLKFLASDGWYAYAGGGEITKISQIIQPDVDAFRINPFSLPAIADHPVATVWKNKMWCSVADNNELSPANNNTIYIHDENSVWWKYESAMGSSAGNITDFAIAKFSTDTVFQLMGGNAGVNQIIKLDVTDTTHAMNSNWDSKEYVFSTDVEFIEATVTMKKQSAGNLTFSFSVDRATYVDFTCDMTAGTGTVIRKVVPIGRVGKSIRLRVSLNTANRTFEVYELRCSYFKSEARRV